MRVLLWHEQHPSVTGGAEAWVSYLATGFKRLGHEAAWLATADIQDARAEFKPDLVVLGTLHNYIGLHHAGYIAHRVPAIWMMHDYWPFCEPRMCMQEWNTSEHGCSAVDGLCDDHCHGGHPVPHPVTEFSAVTGNKWSADIMQRHGLPVEVIEEGIDTELFVPGKKAESVQAVYASAAWNAPWKGMRTLDVALSGTGLSMRLLSGLTREQVAGELAHAGVFVMPSLYEEIWGLALTEAMACGCACVASDVAGLRAQVHDGMGLLVPPGDAEALREAVLWLVEHPWEREQMGRKARAHVETDHTCEAMASRYMGAYARLIGGQ